MDLSKYDKYIKMQDGPDSNFKYIEFIRSETAIRQGIDNTPDNWHLNNMESLVQNGLQTVRNKFGPIIITSGYRCPELCLAVGSSLYSNHTRGTTADIEPLYDIKLIEILNFIHENLDYRELIAEFFPSGGVHFCQEEGGNKRELKLKDDDHNYKIVDIEYINKLYS